MKKIPAAFLFSVLAFSGNLYAQALKKGQVVEVNYSAHWYRSVILQVDGDRYFVHYEGYPSSDDKWVKREYIRTLGADGKATAVNCIFTPPSGNYSNSSAASEGLFKKELYDWYNVLVNGTLTRPVAVGIVYQTFLMKAGYRNTVANLPGRGATRKHSGAPVNAMIYPVRTTYFVCEQYNSGVSQKEVTADFSFFINKDGEWTCSKDS